MTLTKARVSQFEKDQKKYGTKTALYNVIWELAADLMHSIGCTKVKAT